MPYLYKLITCTYLQSRPGLNYPQKSPWKLLTCLVIIHLFSTILILKLNAWIFEYYSLTKLNNVRIHSIHKLCIVKTVLLVPALEELCFRAWLPSPFLAIAFITFAIIGVSSGGINEMNVMLRVFIPGPVVMWLYYIIRNPSKNQESLEIDIYKKIYPLVFVSTSLLFAISHSTNFIEIEFEKPIQFLVFLPQLVGGIIYGFVRIKFGLIKGIIYSFSLHAIHNLLLIIIMKIDMYIF